MTIRNRFYFLIILGMIYNLFTMIEANNSQENAQSVGIIEQNQNEPNKIQLTEIQPGYSLTINGQSPPCEMIF